jgi:hypothetical protein
MATHPILHDNLYQRTYAADMAYLEVCAVPGNPKFNARDRVNQMFAHLTPASVQPANKKIAVYVSVEPTRNAQLAEGLAAAAQVLRTEIVDFAQTAGKQSLGGCSAALVPTLDQANVHVRVVPISSATLAFPGTAAQTPGVKTFVFAAGAETRKNVQQWPAVSLGEAARAEKVHTSIVSVIRRSFSTLSC